MKKMMRIALWLLIALNGNLYAQENSPNQNQDTIRVEPFDGARIVLTGNNMKKLAGSNNLELLKNKFISDFRESEKDRDFPADSKNMIYLASADGRRRLKARPVEETGFDLDREISEFRQNLPVYHYTIYDLGNQFEYHIYVKDTTMLERLASLNCAALLSEATDKEPKALRKANVLQIAPADGKWTITGRGTKRFDVLELGTGIGLGLINSNWSPVIGVSMAVILHNQYGKATFRPGIDLKFHTFADYSNFEFSNIYTVADYSAFFTFNSSRKKERWAGLSVGMLQTQHKEKAGSLDGAWKVGIISTIGDFNVNFDFIRDRNKNSSLGFTITWGF
jgi:hypothetical protein